MKKFSNANKLTEYILQKSNRCTLKGIKIRQLKKNIEVKLMDFGIAYAYDSIIGINRKLLQNPKLLNQVLEHEIEHLERPSFFDTVKIELKDGFNLKKQRLLSTFLRKHPMMGFQSSLPVWYCKGEFSYNSFLLVFYALLIFGSVLAINLFL